MVKPQSALIPPLPRRALYASAPSSTPAPGWEDASMDEQPVAPLTWSASEVFDYSALPPDISLPLQERAERIMQAGRRSGTSAAS